MYIYVSYFFRVWHWGELPLDSHNPSLHFWSFKFGPLFFASSTSVWLARSDGTTMTREDILKKTAAKDLKTSWKFTKIFGKQWHPKESIFHSSFFQCQIFSWHVSTWGGRWDQPHYVALELFGTAGEHRCSLRRNAVEIVFDRLAQHMQSSAAFCVGGQQTACWWKNVTCCQKHQVLPPERSPQLQAQGPRTLPFQAL